MILLLDNYDSFTYNVYQYLSEFASDVRVIRNDQISWPEVQKLRPAGVVISPGPGRPEDSNTSLDVVTNAEDKFPVLGICLGHQAIGLANGGQIVGAPTIMHGKISPINHFGSPLFEGIPSPFEATRYHSLVISPEAFPNDKLEIIAQTPDEVIMGVRHRKYRNIYGIQFHPESILTSPGLKIIENFVNLLNT